MKNQQIAKIFSEIAELLELTDANVFRIMAYRRAAQNIDGFPGDVAALSEKELEAIAGIGKELTAKIHEYLTTGKMAKHEELKKEIPAGVLELLRVPGLGPKTVKLLYGEKRIGTVEELETLARDGRLAGMPGIGKKTEENILREIERIKQWDGRRPLGKVRPLAEEVIRRVRESAPVGQIAVAGSIRRWKETVNDIDILSTSRQPEKVTDAFVKLPNVSRVLSQGPTRSSVITEDGIQVDLRVVEEDSFGAALQYFTGNVQHNVKLREMAARKGLKINEYGVFSESGESKIGGEKEEDIYRALGLSFIPPELREDTGEIEAAKKGTLPDLVTLEDVRGDLHVHTNWSDGSHELEDIAAVARKRGYRYIAITDHSKGLGIAHGLDEARLAEQIKRIDAINRKHRGFTLLKGTEVDIRSDGRLDLSDDALAGLDIVVASIHSGFKQSREQITKRLLSAIRNPCVSVIAHPTGRIIGERDAYNVDLEAVIKEAARYGVAMEINAYPLRLDLNDTQVRLAKEYGVPFVIGADVHVTDQYDFMIYGVSVARRGWLEKKDVLNTLGCTTLIKRLKSCRAGKLKDAKRG